jgi:hypothetical protein
MPASVQSIDALWEFRGHLLEFAHVAHQALDILQVEARRGVDWLTVDRVKYWKNENRKAWDNVSRCKDAVHQARIQRQIADHIPDCIDEKKALAKAQEYLKLTERKLAALQHWCREVSHAMNEFEGRYSATASVLDGDIPRAVAVLERLAQHLEEYTKLAAAPVERLAPAGEQGDALDLGGTSVVSMAQPLETNFLATQLPPEQVPADEATHNAETERSPAGRG